MSVVLPSAVIETCATQIANLASRHEHSRPIVGVFDSGVGGLTVLPALHAPTQIFDSQYLGDTAHFPYGEKTEAELVPLVLADIAHLVTAGCSLVGIACNTASIVWNDVFILGCTHYGHIAPAIKSALPPHVVMLDPSVLLGQALRSLALAVSFPTPSTTPSPHYNSVITFTGETPTTSVY